MNIDASVEGFEIPAPGDVHELIPIQDRVGVLHKGLEDLELRGRQFDLIAFHENGLFQLVQYKVSHGKQAVIFLRRHTRLALKRPSEHGLDPCQEFPRVKGFRQIIIGAQFQTHYAIRILSLCRKHDHRDLEFHADVPEQIESIAIRQHDVQDDDVRLIRPNLIDDP